MENTSWLRQTSEKPLFSDILWSRPENRRQAGKLLIVGGNSSSFNAVSAAYTAAAKAGIGTTRVIVPHSLEKMLTQVFPEAEFAPGTPSGSFARAALAPITDASTWADGVLLAGDFGKNAETSILLENFSEKFNGPLTLAGDGLENFYNESSSLILDRSDTVLVANFARLQKLLTGRLLLKHSLNLAQIVDALAKYSKTCPASVITLYAGQIVAACGGKVSTTPLKDPMNFNMVNLAAFASVWVLQQPGKPLEALTTAAYCFADQA